MYILKIYVTYFMAWFCSKTHKDPNTEGPSKPAMVQLILFEEAQLDPFSTRQNTDYQTNVSL